MRRILFAIIAVTLLVSCGNSNAEQSNVYVAQETRMDAIIEDSLALIAWGDVRFGMSKQEVMNSKAFGGKKESASENRFETYDMDFNTRFELSRQFRLEELMHVTAHFENNELYKVELKSLKKDASHLDDMINDCYKFADQFTKRYKEPYSIKAKDDVSILNFDGGVHKIEVACYVIGEKYISIELNNDDSEYSYLVAIANYSFPKKKYQPTQKVERMKSEDSIRKTIRENSF